MAEAAKGLELMVKHSLMGMGLLSAAFYKKYGKEALPIITEVMSKGGEEIGKIMKQMMPVKGMKDFSEAFQMMGSMMGAKFETIELSDDKFHFKGSHCPLCLEGTSRDLCEATMTHDAKMASVLLGKQVKIKILKSVAVGDKECEVIFSTK